MDMERVLLVEGNDDLHVIAALCQKFQIAHNFHIEDCKGVSNLLHGLPVRLKGSGEIHTMGIVIDADLDLISRWNEIKNILKNSGKYSVIPEEFPKGGLILYPDDSDDIKVGVWIMPNNEVNGMLEDFISFLIPEYDELMKPVNVALDSIETQGINRYANIHRSKAYMHTWLAWQEDPGTPMGLAITKKYLSTHSQICNLFVDWIKGMFE